MIFARLHITVLFALLLLPSCSCFLFPPKPYAPPLNETTSILLRCDNDINEGMGLPLDVIYITSDGDLKAVIKIGPDTWFDSEEREHWPFKQTLMLRSGEEVLLKLSKPPETKFIVIFASFYRVKEQQDQQVIIAQDAAEQEVVWVGARALYH
jgi:hypothetical protein